MRLYVVECGRIVPLAGSRWAHRLLGVLAPGMEHPGKVEWCGLIRGFPVARNKPPICRWQTTIA